MIELIYKILSEINYTEIILAVIAAAGTIYGIYSNVKKEKAELDLRELEEEISYDVHIRLDDANRLQKIITDLMANTKVDRFLMFIAENGGKSPLTFTTAILENHKNNIYLMLSIGATNKYVKFRFDEPYRHMLSYIESTNEGVYLDVAKMESSKLKDIYVTEQINHSSVWFHKRQRLTDDKHVIIYSSFATHNERPFTKKEKTLIELAAHNLSSLNISISQK